MANNYSPIATSLMVAIINLMIMREKEFKVEQLEERLEMAKWDDCCNNSGCACATEGTTPEPAPGGGSGGST